MSIPAYSTNISLSTCLIRRQNNHPAATLTLAATESFAIALGTVFTEPALWSQYAAPMFYGIVLLSIAVALLTVTIRWADAE